jgi:hypothetical protein
MKYHVSLYICPGNIPFVFAKHPWFVVNNNGKISRYEVLFRSDYNGRHLHKDFLSPFVGIGIFPYINKFFWSSRLMGSIEGNEGSLAHHLTEYIQNSENDYPYRNKYSLSGPNSNTYAQWVLSHFPEFKVKLPWNAFGKNYDG